MKTIKMTQAQLDNWTAALRSGDYTQGCGLLDRTENDTYCCLGVQQKALVGECKFVHTPNIEYLNENNITYLDERGKKVRSPYIPSYERSLWELNDILELSFNQIADIIEENTEIIG